MLASNPSSQADANEAVRWYLQAAIQGHAGAQNNLGALYTTGQGLPKDLVQAYFWFSVASENGNKDAPDNLIATANEMSPAEIAAAKKLIRSNAERYRTKKP